MSVNSAAKTLKALHVPSKPLVFANVWDTASLNAVASLNTDAARPVKAAATASWALAAARGVADEDLSLEQNLDALRRIGPAAAKVGLPLSADLQDGYGDRIQEAVTEAVKAGVAGANIEDSIPSAKFDKGIAGSLYSKDEQVRRLKLALQAAKDAGCADFALNARCDVFRLDVSPDLDDATRLSETISRGQAYLAVGATTIFVWGGPRGLRTSEVEALVKAFDGKLAVIKSSKEGAHTTGELGQLGVARISVGPAMFLAAMNTVKETAQKLLVDGNL